MSTTKRNMKVETLAWITDDEAEFWTSTSPLEKNNSTNYLSRTKTNKPVEVSSDGLYFKTKDKLETEGGIEDSLVLSYKQIIEQQVKEVTEKVEKRQTSDIFHSHGNDLEINTSLNNYLLKLQPNFSLEENVLDENIFLNIEINKLKDNFLFIKDLRSFIDELIEETKIIMGKTNKETLNNQTILKTESSSSASNKSK